MIYVNIRSSVYNMQMRPDLVRNQWRSASDFVFVIVDDKPRDGYSFRARLTAPAGSIESRKLRPRRLRAEAVRAAASLARRRDGLPISWSQINDAYIAVLKQDGCGPGFVLALGAYLHLFGFCSRLHRYWAIPRYDERPKVDEGV